MNRQPPTRGRAISSEEPYFDLGNYTRPITSRNAEAQAWFNRGLIWCYGFNHEEATYCFEQALLHDPTCAMAYWGLAYALGPNYNKPWDFFDAEERGSTVARTHDAVLKASKYAQSASEVERTLTEAITARYPRDEPVENMSVWNQEYADAMRKVYTQFPDDLDIAVLCADALMGKDTVEAIPPSTPANFFAVSLNSFNPRWPIKS
jgi:tetratricopeptide (TPR) repeat protein